jgi:protein-S-isoprenylcysteine O-methyltransferase Ste14
MALNNSTGETLVKNISGPVTLTDTQQNQIQEELKKIGKIVVSLWIIGGTISLLTALVLKSTTNFSLLKIIIIFICINIAFFIIAHIYNTITSINLIKWVRNKSDINEKYEIK